jgi:hypothetical protein
LFILIFLHTAQFQFLESREEDSVESSCKKLPALRRAFSPEGFIPQTASTKKQAQNKDMLIYQKSNEHTKRREELKNKTHTTEWVHLSKF